jgi:hypothetical protein
MAKEGREEPQWRIERQGARLRQKARHEFETAPARRRLPQGLFLCEDGRDEVEANVRKDRQRPRLTHQ